jgi:hypothetical protein
MADQTRTSTLEELHRAIEIKERDLSKLDLMLADYHTQHSQLIRELGRLRAQLRHEDETALSASEP